MNFLLLDHHGWMNPKDFVAPISSFSSATIRSNISLKASMNRDIFSLSGLQETNDVILLIAALVWEFLQLVLDISSG